MKVAVLGDIGLTGGLVLTQALKQGHEVVAVVRAPSKLALQHPAHMAVGGSPLWFDDLE
jgi:putative NADH-flavin reductase